MKGFWGYLLAALLISAGLALFCQNVHEPDCFYHLGHARLYWEKGIFYRPFPWASYSMIGELNSDLWWGFHVLLAPLGWIKDPAIAVVVAPGVLMFIHLLITRAAVVQLGLSQWSALVLLPASAGYLARMDTIRPQALSAPLLLLLMACLVTELHWGALVTALFIGFIHPTLSSLVGLVAVSVILSEKIRKRKKRSYWLEVAVILVALSAASIRPGMQQGFQLMRIQLIDLFTVRKAGAITNFGVELEPANYGYFAYALFAPVCFLAVCLLFSFRPKTKSSNMGMALPAVICSLLAVAITFLISRRGVDQAAPFAVLAGLVFVHQTGGFNTFASVLLGAYSAFIIGWWGRDHLRKPYVDRYNASAMRGVSQFLRKNTEKGEIVGHGLWSDFGPLFYWNRHNRFFGGMDPIFQYRFSQEKYWLMTPIAPARTPGRVTRRDPRSTSDELLISEAWPRELNTRWIVLNKRLPQKSMTWIEMLSKSLTEDPMARKVYEDDYASIFRLDGRAN